MKSKIIDTLQQHERKTDALGIDGWLCSLIDSRTASIGSKSFETGGVYAPFETHQALTGNLYIKWSDGLISQMNLTRLLVQDAENMVRLMRDAAFTDKFAPEIPEPQFKTDVQVYSPSVETLTGQKMMDLMDYLGKANQTFQILNSRNCAAAIDCALERWVIASSKGLNTEFLMTSMEFSAAAESLYHVEAGSRGLLTLPETAEILAHLQAMIPIIKTKVNVPHKMETLVFMPNVAQAFVKKYLLENLNAETIFDNRSAFRLEDVEQQRQLFHQAFSLLHDPCRPLGRGSYPMDSQGLTAKPVVFFSQGKLLKAQTTLKGSRQTGWTPTPFANPDSLVIQADSETDLFNYIDQTEQGVLITGVLGLHTQDSGRGDYSVAAPHGIEIRNGKLTGSAKTILRGNFFKDLQQPLMTLTSPYHQFKGIAFKGTAIF